MQLGWEWEYFLRINWKNIGVSVRGIVVMDGSRIPCHVFCCKNYVWSSFPACITRMCGPTSLRLMMLEHGLSKGILM